MNQLSQSIFNIYHFTLNLRDTLEYCIERPHSKTLYEQRKNVLTNGYKGTPITALSNFIENNKKQGGEAEEAMNNLTKKLDEFVNEFYSPESRIITVSGEEIRVDHTQHQKIYEYVVDLYQTLLGIMKGFVSFGKQNGQYEPIIGELLEKDERLFRSVLAMLVMRDYIKAFGEFQKVVGESQGKASPQSTFIVENEIKPLAGYLRFSRANITLTDNKTLDLLDKVETVIQMAEGRRDRRDNKSFKEIFDSLLKELNEQVRDVEAPWKELYQRIFEEIISLSRAQATDEAANKA